MDRMENGLDPNSFIVKRRYKPHDGDGCILCGNENAKNYEFYCTSEIARKVEQVSGSRDKKITSTYMIEKTVNGKLCDQCIRSKAVMDIIIGLIIMALTIVIWIVLWRFKVGLLIIPIILILGALGFIISGITRLTGKELHQNDGDETLRDLLQGNYPGYKKYMTRSEWDKNSKAG